MQSRSDLASVYRQTHKNRTPPSDDTDKGVDSNPFLDAFIAIDVDGSETITVEELRAYMKKNNFQENFIKKWLTMFDLDSDGVIKLEEFCEVLGLQPKNARDYRREALARSGLPSGITVISVNMVDWMQQMIVQQVQHACAKFKDERDIATHVKQHLDVELGKLWHVVIVLGQYFASYSHEPDMAFFFKMDSRIFLIWKTPPP